MTTSTPSSATATPKPAATRRPRTMSLKLDRTDADSRRQATAILEVMAGVLTPTDAAKALSLSLPAYYKLESRAMLGLVNGCKPAARGPTPSPDAELSQLRKQNHRLQQEVHRYQALARTAQRAAGLASLPAAPKTDGKGRRKRRPSVRALKVIEVMRQKDQVAVAAPASGAALQTASPS